MKDEGVNEEIRALRQEIKEITEKIITLIAERLSKAERIGLVKERAGLPTLDLRAERELLEFIKAKAEGLGLDADTAQRVLTILLNESVKRQERPRRRAQQRITHMDIFRRAKELELEGREIIHLEVGEPDFGAPDHVAELLTESAKKGYAMYGEAKGRLELRSAIREFLSERFKIDVKEDNIIVTPGGRFAVFLAAASVLVPGDLAVIIDPSWPMYRQTVEHLCARPLTLRTTLEERWRPSLERLDELISSGSKYLFINYPNNPTGVVMSEGELGEVVELCERKGVYLLSDEVYMDYSFKDFTSVLEFGYERAMMVMSFSKSWGMTGYRIGFLVGNREIIDKAARMQSMMLTCVPEFVQMAALSALRDRETPKRYREVMRERLEAVCKMLDEVGAKYVKPDGGMYVFPRINLGGLESTEFALRLLEERGVSLAPGNAFGDYPDHVRISTGMEVSKIIKGMGLLLEAIKGKEG